MDMYFNVLTCISVYVEDDRHFNAALQCASADVPWKKGNINVSINWQITCACGPSVPGGHNPGNGNARAPSGCAIQFDEWTRRIRTSRRLSGPSSREFSRAWRPRPSLWTCKGKSHKHGRKALPTSQLRQGQVRKKQPSGRSDAFARQLDWRLTRK